MKLNKDNVNKHLKISLIIMAIIFASTYIITLLEIKTLYYVSSTLFAFNTFYLLGSLVCLFIVNKQSKGKKENLNNTRYAYKYKSTQKETKPKKKFEFKTENDRLYDEAVKYFGTKYVKNRSKADVIEEYLKEDKMIDEEGNWKK